MLVTWMKQVLSVLRAEVKEGCISLVGKVTPKGEKTFLLKNVSFFTPSFGINLVKCVISLRVPHGEVESFAMLRSLPVQTVR